MNTQHPIATGRQLGVVGHEHQRHAVLAMAAKQKLDDLMSGGLVEIAGRLVGDDDGRTWRQRPGQRDALLLAAG